MSDRHFYLGDRSSAYGIVDIAPKIEKVRYEESDHTDISGSLTNHLAGYPVYYSTLR